MKKPNPYVQCFYCEEMLKRPQGRAAHIRKAHPGAPYRPTPEEIVEYKAQHQSAEQSPAETSQPAIPPRAFLTPREHLVAAICSVKEGLESTRSKIPALELELEGLRRAQSRMEQDLGALDTALASIGGGTSQPPPPEPDKAETGEMSGSPLTDGIPALPARRPLPPRATRSAATAQA